MGSFGAEGLKGLGFYVVHGLRFMAVCGTG